MTDKPDLAPVVNIQSQTGAAGFTDPVNLLVTHGRQVACQPGELPVPDKQPASTHTSVHETNMYASNVADVLLLDVIIDNVNRQTTEG